MLLFLAHQVPENAVLLQCSLDMASTSTVGSLLPTQKLSRITKIILNKANGDVVLDNGIPVKLGEPPHAHLHRCKCGDRVEVHSFGTSHDSMGKLKDGESFWEDMLMDTLNINFYGKWSTEILAFILSKARKLNAVSFTYWDCVDPAKVLKAINSNGLRELSMQIPRDKHMSVIEALEESGLTLEHLMLVFEHPFSCVLLPFFQKRLAKVLTPGAVVILLFVGELYCIRNLINEGYVVNCYIKIAANNICKDRSPKVHDKHEVYYKYFGNAHWLVGSCIGRKKVSQAVPHICEPNAKLISVPHGDLALRYEADDGDSSNPEYKALYEKNEYDILEKLIGKKGESRADAKHAVNLWIKVQKLIYSDGITQMLTSNGFYIILEKMDDQFATMTTTPRFEFICTSPCHISTKNMKELLAGACHIEFIGTWFSNVIVKIARKFTTRLYALTMMQIEIHGRKPLILIFNAMPDEVEKGLKVFHFDTRATIDRSVGSFSHACWEQIDAERKFLLSFEELIIISNKWSCRHYDHVLKKYVGFECRIFKHVQDCVKWLEPNGSATTVVIETSEDYRKAGFYGRSFPVMTPIAYPYHHGRYETAAELSRLMDGYHQVAREGRHIYIAVPRYPMS